MTWSKEIVDSEVFYRTSRSRGAGGQHVSKTETKVEVILRLETTQAFDEKQLERMNTSLANRINSAKELSVYSSEARSQLRNKQIALDKLFELIEGALQVQKPRKRTKPSKAAIRKRLEGKTKRSQTKSQRKWKLGGD